ncbi:2Fe-2S iron-sulfur cluster-binding protein [Pseudacidovorax intermedius]|uniref:CDP-6-deoxy-L-threo-D-glycero-4-hexulose-3-dehydrase reductase n=1 Tax=Pseudacidovorax intermedius TaxID=433924 RepID=A0A147GRL0_9BURK|nr:2Fe-2S iron-sulfur cluster-binding protein [Pseudacidovorax intermedius]KTT19293.1 CDP-6-deoxy-L-threo-D-glycero-4-hexulose-3-dehydrase reductase [Pseudacidovorax intermedius]
MTTFSVSLPSGKTFAAEEGSTLVDAAAAAGVNLPYSCKTGRCSTCKCRLLSGESRALHEETGLSDDEKAAGWILGCVRTPTTDVVLDVEDLEGVQLPAQKTVPCRIDTIQRLVDDVVKIELRLPPTADFKFLAGQYVDVIGPGGVRRSYSLAAADRGTKKLEIHVRAVEGGVMSRYWFEQAKPNDLLRLHGPLGTFFLRKTAGRDLVFLATGTGIAPVKAMLESMSELPPEQLPRSVHVLWGGRRTQDIYFDVAAPGLPLTFTPVLSRQVPEWAGALGYVHDIYLGRSPALDQVTVYACGSDAMIHSARTALAAAGLPERQFLSDAFVCSSTS